MNKIAVAVKFDAGKYQMSRDSEILLKEYCTENNGEIGRMILTRERPPKTLQQLRFLKLGFRKLADYLGYADPLDVELYFKEMCMVDYREVRSPKTSVVKRLKYYKSFADETVDGMSDKIERFLRWCDEIGFPMRQLYFEWMEKHHAT